MNYTRPVDARVRMAAAARGGPFRALRVPTTAASGEVVIWVAEGREYHNALRKGRREYRRRGCRSPVARSSGVDRVAPKEITVAGVEFFELVIFSGYKIRETAGPIGSRTEIDQPF